jgi:peptide/nickel transport system substrate-binding protein
MRNLARATPRANLLPLDAVQERGRGGSTRPRGRVPALVKVALPLASVACALLVGCRSTTTVAGRLEVLATNDFQKIDPGAAYAQFDYMLEYATQRSLYGWKPGTEGRPVPDLAAAPAQVRDGGLTVVVRLKGGIRFSPPVSREVNSGDVKYAIERAAKPNVGNPYFHTYFGDLVGANAFLAGRASSITGIETRDARTILFHLTAPTAAILTQALSLPITAPVPREYAAKYDAMNPSSYGEHMVSTGPYTLVRYVPGVKATLRKNPAWDPKTDWRPAHLKEIDFLFGQSEDVASRKILAGHGEVSGDFSAPPAELRSALTDKRRRSQIAFAPDIGVLLAALNTSVPPLDDVNVRRAIVAATDRVGLRLTRGGATAGTVATHYLFPGMPGYLEAGGEAGPGYDFLANPHGSLSVARAYMRRAGYASGRYSGHAPLLMVTDSDQAGRKAAEVFERRLALLGFNVTLRSVSHQAVYARFCGVPAAQVAICPNIGWLKDFYDSQTVLDPIFNGRAIRANGSSNYSELDDPTINRAIAQAERLVAPAARARAWGRIDRLVTGEAAGVPWLWLNQADLRSADVNGVVNRFTGSWDLSFTSLRDR